MLESFVNLISISDFSLIIFLHPAEITQNSFKVLTILQTYLNSDSVLVQSHSRVSQTVLLCTLKLLLGEERG